MQIQALVLQQPKLSLQGRAAVGTAWFTVPEPNLSQLRDIETTIAFRERIFLHGKEKEEEEDLLSTAGGETSPEQQGARAQCRASCSEWRRRTEA